MRKHNKRFAQRMPRVKGDRTNVTQGIAHSLTNSKPFQYGVNRTLQALLSTVGA